MSSTKLPNSLPSKIWYCKIGEVPEELLHREWPTGADSPMRDAVSEAFRQITGEPPMFIFSGWAAELTEYERAVVENREPDPEVIRADLQRELAILPSAEQSNSLPPEIGALIDEALTFSHQDCGERDEDGYGCIRCAAENADMRRTRTFGRQYKQTVLREIRRLTPDA